MSKIPIFLLMTAVWISGGATAAEERLRGADSRSQDALDAYCTLIDRNGDLTAFQDLQLLRQGPVPVRLTVTDKKSSAFGSGCFRTLDGRILDVCIRHLGNWRAGTRDQWKSREGKIAHEFHHVVQFLRGELGFLNITRKWVLYAYDVYDEYDAYRVQYEVVRAQNPNHPDLAHGVLRLFSADAPTNEIIRYLRQPGLYGCEKGIVLERRAATQSIRGLPAGVLYQTARWFFITGGDGHVSMDDGIREIRTAVPASTGR